MNRERHVDILKTEIVGLLPEREMYDGGPLSQAGGSDRVPPTAPVAMLGRLISSRKAYAAVAEELVNATDQQAAAEVGAAARPAGGALGQTG